MNAPSTFQNDSGIFLVERVVQDTTLGLNLPVRRLATPIKTAVDLVHYRPKGSPFLGEKCPLSVERSQLADRLSSK
jgi:hypothetical protein